MILVGSGTPFLGGTGGAGGVGAPNLRLGLLNAGRLTELVPIFLPTNTSLGSPLTSSFKTSKWLSDSITPYLTSLT